MITESCITGCNIAKFVLCLFLAILAVWLSFIPLRGSQMRSERISVVPM